MSLQFTESNAQEQKKMQLKIASKIDSQITYLTMDA